MLLRTLGGLSGGLLDTVCDARGEPRGDVDMLDATDPTPDGDDWPASPTTGGDALSDNVDNRGKPRFTLSAGLSPLGDNTGELWEPTAPTGLSAAPDEEPGCIGGESTQIELTTSGAALEPQGGCSAGACSSVFSTSGEDIRALVDALNWPSGHILPLCWIQLPLGGELAVPPSDEPTDGLRPSARVTLNGGLYVGDVAACRLSWYLRALADCGELGEEDRVRSLESCAVRCEPCEATPDSPRPSRCGR